MKYLGGRSRRVNHSREQSQREQRTHAGYRGNLELQRNAMRCVRKSSGRRACEALPELRSGAPHNCEGGVC